MEKVLATSRQVTDPLTKYILAEGRIVEVASEPDEIDVLLKRIQDDVNALAAYCDSAPWTCLGLTFDHPPVGGIAGDTCPTCGVSRGRVREVLHRYLGLRADADVPWIQERSF
jgi:hypothetical protein